MIVKTPAPHLDSLQAFERLEDLAINQTQLGGKPMSLVRSGAWTDLEGFLPRSIKRVDFLYVWFDCSAALEDLARDAPAKLPNLKSIRLRHFSLRITDDEYSNAEDWFPYEAGEQERLRDLFAAVSIALSWDRIPYKTLR